MGLPLPLPGPAAKQMSESKRPGFVKPGLFSILFSDTGFLFCPSIRFCDQGRTPIISAPTKANVAHKINALIGLVSPISSLLLKSYRRNLRVFVVHTSKNFVALCQIHEGTLIFPLKMLVNFV
ncbi:hypothetical protein ACFPLB_16260 [Aquamicrobium segne]|uniref:Uncharacterized protein n=1 Tax=Aquamicrobium segne TaxID=469547 RepID=A0ABW0H694_9HYPH